MGIGLLRYTALSLLAVGAVTYHAFATREHFFPATVYLSTSKLAIAVVGNLLFASALCFYNVLIKVFLGSLRDIELEMIRERLSSAVMESLLALTIFREEFGAFFISMFAALLFIKVMHWLVQDRVDFVEISPNISKLQHVRLVLFMATLLVLDVAFLQYTIQGTIQSGGASVMLLFAFEYIIQASNIVRYSLKYIMSMIDVNLEGRWETKSIYVFYLELITDMFQVFVYIMFFMLVFYTYGLPLHLVRDLYYTVRNFRTRLIDFLRFRQVNARLDRFPDATHEDLQRSGVCIICREEMAGGGSNKKLVCGHVFHLHCLRSWLEKQQNCPTCRGSVFRAAPPEPPAQDAAAQQPPPAAAGQAPAHVPAGAPAAGAAPQQHQQPPHHGHAHAHAEPHFHVPNMHRVRLAFSPHRHPAAGHHVSGGAPHDAAAAQAAPLSGVQMMGQHEVPMMQPPFVMPMMPFGMPFGIPPGNIMEQQAAAMAAYAAHAAAAAVQAPPPGWIVMPQPSQMLFPGMPNAVPAAATAGSSSTPSMMIASIEAAQELMKKQMDMLQDQLNLLKQSIPETESGVAVTTTNNSDASGSAPITNNTDNKSASSSELHPPAVPVTSTHGSDDTAASVAASPSDVASSADTCPVPSEASDEQEEIRRRRLQKFT